MPSYSAAADAHDEEGLHSTSHAHHPRHADKQQDAKDVLDAGQVDTQHCAQSSFLATEEYHTGS